MSASWNQVVVNFCEGEIDGYPEPVNTWSSIVIGIIGIYGLFVSNINNIAIRKIYSCMIYASVGAFLLHYKGFNFYRSLAVIPLFLVTWLLNELIWLSIVNILTDKHSALRDYITNALVFVIYGCLIYTIADAMHPDHPWGIKVGFVEMFAGPQLLSAFGMSVLALFLRRRIGVPAKRYLALSISVVVIANVFWLVSDSECSTNETYATYGHAIWHILYAYGAHIFIQMIVYIHILSKKEIPVFRPGKLFLLFPVISTITREGSVQEISSKMELTDIPEKI